MKNEIRIGIILLAIGCSLIATFWALDSGLKERGAYLAIVTGHDSKECKSAYSEYYRLEIEYRGKQYKAVVPKEYYQTVRVNDYVLVIESRGRFTDKPVELYLPDLHGSYGVYPLEGQ